MLAVLGGLTWKNLKGSADDDWIDRASHLWTVTIMMVFALLGSTGQYVGDPIHCWCPAEFTSTYVDYAKNYCWISNTYYVPTESEIPSDISERREAELNYYQWVPIILLFMAFMFKAPNIAWHLLNTKSGINLSKLCDMVDKINISDCKEREEILTNIAKYIDRWTRENRNYRRNIAVRIRGKLSSIFFCFAKRDGCFLTGFYVFTKTLYCVNCVGHFYLLNSFLSMDFSGYGLEIALHLAQRGAWKESPRFPRVTLCDFTVRQLNNVQRWTVQCVLPINLFNEKIFAIIWFWLFAVSVLSFFNLVAWLYYLLFSRNKETFIRKHLRVSDKKLTREFANDYLREDGCFLLRIVGKNSTDIILSDLARILFELFKNYPSRPRKKSESIEI